MCADTPLVIAAYGEGELDASNIANNLESVQAAGWTTIMLGLFHPHESGDIYFNTTANPICVGGAYEAPASWTGRLVELQNSGDEPGSQIELIASFGGGSVGDFTNIKNIYDSNDGSFAGTTLEKNIQAFADNLGGVVTAIDMDAEDCYDLESFVAFCRLVMSMGFSVTFCPYKEQEFWVSALALLQGESGPSVLRFNLQCYAATNPNPDPDNWASAIRRAIHGFHTDNFILAGAKSGHAASDVQATLEQYHREPSVGGAFLWTLDTIIKSERNHQRAYVNAIKNALH